MPYTENNIIQLIATAVKMKKGHIEDDITNQDSAYKGEVQAFEDARAAAQSAFDTSYSSKETSKDTEEAAVLQAALNAVQAARDAVVNDDGEPSVVNTLFEMEAQIASELAAFNAQKTAYENLLSTERGNIETAFGTIADWNVSFDTAYSSISVAGAAATEADTNATEADTNATEADTNATEVDVNATEAYSAAAFIGGTYPNITPAGDAVANQIIHPSIINLTLPEIFTVINPSGESGTPTNDYTSVENMFSRYGIKKDSNEDAQKSQGLKDFWEWFMDLNNAPTVAGGGFAHPKFDALKNKWAETMVPIGYTATNESSNHHPEDVFLHLGNAQWAWGNLSKKGYQDVAYEKAGWKSDASWFLSQFGTAMSKIKEMQTPELSYYNAFADTMESHLNQMSYLINLALTESSGYYYNGEAVGENLL